MMKTHMVTNQSKKKLSMNLSFNQKKNTNSDRENQDLVFKRIQK